MSQHRLLRYTFCIVFCFAVLNSVKAQTGNNEIVFRNSSGDFKSLQITPAGFIFNNELIYYTEVTNFPDPQEKQDLNNGDISGYSSVSIPDGEARGFESPWYGDSYQSTGDVTAVAMLGFGEYTIQFAGETYTLNLIDGSWYYDPDPFQVKKILFEATPTGVNVTFYQGNDPPVQIPYSYIMLGSYGRTRERNGYTIGGINYKFNIDGYYSPYIPIPSTNVTTAILDVNTQLYNDATIRDGMTIEIRGFDTYPTKFKVMEDAILRGGDWSILNFNPDPYYGDAELEFEGTSTNQGKSILNHPLILRGTGNIIYSNIFWTTHFQVDDQSVLRFRSGGKLSFISSSSKQNINVNGKLEFYNQASYYLLGDSLSTIYVQSPNTNYSTPAQFTTYEGVSIFGIKNLQGGDNSEVLSFGSAEHPCEWNFTSRAPMDIYDYIEGNYTDYKGMPTTFPTNQKWDGIFVAFDSSVIYLNHCIVEDIYTDDGAHGCAVHLYETNGDAQSPHRRVNWGNEITNSWIKHDATDSPRTGDGIIVQGGIGVPSYLRVLYSCIYDHWYTGLANLNGNTWSQLEGNSIFGITTDTTTVSTQIQGIVNAHASFMHMTNNCIKYHAVRGLYAFDENFTTCEYGNFSTEGHNAIWQNGPYTADPSFTSAQIVLKAASTFIGGWDVPVTGEQIGVLNNFSHYNLNVKRAHIESSTATIQKDWWGEVPSNCNNGFGDLTSGQISRFFTLINNPIVDYSEAKCDSLNTNLCSGTCPEGSGIGNHGIAPPILTGNGFINNIIHTTLLKFQLVPQNMINYYYLINNYFANNQIADAYQLIADIINNSIDAHHVFQVSSWALQMELRRAYKKIESIDLCLERLAIFLSTQLGLVGSNDLKAPLMYTLAHVMEAAGDYLSVEQIVQQIRSQFPNTEFSKRALHLAQLVAMARWDTLGVTNTISQMVQESVPEDEIHIARSMQMGFIRAKPQYRIPKHIFLHPYINSNGFEAKVDNNHLISISNYPNPFNPSTTIEYYLPKSTHVILTIYNTLGQKIDVLVDEDQMAGKHFVNFKPSDLSINPPSGIYYYKFTAFEQTLVGRCNLIK